MKLAAKSALSKLRNGALGNNSAVTLRDDALRLAAFVYLTCRTQCHDLLAWLMSYVGSIPSRQGHQGCRLLTLAEQAHASLAVTSA